MKQKNLLPNLQQSYWLFFFDNFEKEILRWTVRFLIDLVDCLGSFLTKNGQIAVRRKLIKDDHFIWCTCSLRKLYFQVGFLYNWLFFVNCTVWTLLHNQSNQSNCWKKWKFLGFLRKNQISIDDSLCLIIICSHFVSIKSRKIRVFSKFAKKQSSNFTL